MKTAFVDVDSQLDFLFPAGALYVWGAERIVPAISRLNRFAAERGIQVVSTVDAHTENDPEFHAWPPHCIAGTWGQRKAESTLLEKRVVIPNLPGDLALEGARQIILEKQTVDVFQARSLQHVVEHLNADHFVVYGVVTEICVLHAARGLLRAGKSVTVVTDGVATLHAPHSDAALAEVRAGGGKLATVAEVVAAATP